MAVTALKPLPRTTPSFTTIAAKQLAARGAKGGLLKRLVNPVAKFIGSYFVHLGLLDGARGFTIASISAYATWLKYDKLRRLQQG